MHRKDIIAASVLLSVVFLSIMGLATRLLWMHYREKDGGLTGAEERRIHPGLAERSIGDRRPELVSDPISKVNMHSFAFDRSWRRKIIGSSKKKARENETLAPSISGLIKAGDEGVFASALFNNLNHGGDPAGDLSLEMLLDIFAEATRTRPGAERAEYSPAMKRYLAKRGKKGGLRQSQSHRASRDIKRPEMSFGHTRNSIDANEKGVERSKSKRRSLGSGAMGTTTSPRMLSGEEKGADANPHNTTWTEDVQNAEYSEDGKLSITVTSAELAAFSIILGSPATMTQSPISATKQQEIFPVCNNNKIGAFGISIHSTPTLDGNCHISLKSHTRSIPQLPPPESGYSTLSAKHFAYGSLPSAVPISGHSNEITSVLFTDSALDALRTGKPLQLQKELEQPSQSNTLPVNFLSALPHSRSLNMLSLNPSPPSASTLPYPSLPPPLLSTISALPFQSSLPPLASKPLIESLRFIASSGLPPGRLLQRLESLVEKVHRYLNPTSHTQSASQSQSQYRRSFNASPRQSFTLQSQQRGTHAGPYTGTNVFGPIYNVENAAHLYRERMRLGRLSLEDLPEYELSTDTLAHKSARIGRYGKMLEMLITLLYQVKGRDGVEEDGLQEAMRREIERSYASALSTFRTTANDEDIIKRTRTKTKTAPTLAAQVEPILKEELPLSIETIAVVARLVVVAWTLSVGVTSFSYSSSSYLSKGTRDRGFIVDVPMVGDGKGDRKMVFS